jgi:ABC-type nitrate/sulfonate/bicarbonate transport system substrate-binding protein
MDEQNLESQDTPQNPDSTSDAVTSEPTSDDGFTSEGGESVEELKEKNKQLYARLKKLEAKVKSSAKTEEPKKVVENQDGGKPDDKEWKEKIEFLVKRRDFDADELEIVSTFAKGLGKPLEEAVKHPAVEGALKALREKKEAERASLPASSRSSGGDDNSLLAKWKSGKLSQEEFKENFRKIQEEFFSTKRGNRSFE